MGTANEPRHGEESNGATQEPGDGPAAPVVTPAKPPVPARQGDPFGESRTRETFEPSVNNRTK